MRTKGFVLIGRVDDAYYFADSVFKHDGGLEGVTGCVVRPVSPEEWEWASDPENVAERYVDYYRELIGDRAEMGCAECGGYPDDDGCESCGIERLTDFVDRAIHIDGIAHLMFDESYGCDASPVFDALGIEHECTDCIGCGRIFARFNGKPIEFDEVYNERALAAILAYEDGKVGYDFAAYNVFEA